MTSVRSAAMGMALTQDDLIAGEEVLRSKAANAVIRPNDYGLERFPFDQYMPLVGMGDREAIGGKLHLTSYRLLFKAHRVNRAKGEFSIFLPTIRDAAAASHRVTRKIRIVTPSQEYEFVMWGIPAFLTLLSEQRRQLGENEVEDMLRAIQSHPGVISDDLEVSRGVDLLIRGTATALKVLGAARGRGIVSTLINLADLLAQ